MFDPKRLWFVEAVPVGATSWLVIADNEHDAKDMAEELERDISFDWDVMPASIKDGVLVSCTDMGADDCVIADPDMDNVITLRQLRTVIAEWHQQQQRAEAERNNGQIGLPLQ